VPAPWSTRMRSVASSGWDALRMYRGTALLLIAVVAVTLAGVLPIVSLLAPEWATRLRLTGFAGAAGGLDWSGAARSPTSLQQEAVGIMFQSLLGAALATITVGALTALTLFGARASLRSSEITIRRAVGASRRTLFGAALFEAAIMAAAALLVGGAIAALVIRATLADWPGSVRGAGSAAVLAVLSGAVLGLLFLITLPLVFARRGPIVGPPAKPLQLSLPALQLGLGLIALTAGALLSRRAAEPVAQGDRPAPSGEVYSLAAEGFSSAERGRRYTDLLAQLSGQPGFATVSLNSAGALVGLGTVSVVTTDCGRCSFGGLPLRWHLESATHQFVSADSFQALGVHLLAGRGIGGQDRWDSPRVAVVSRGLAIRHFQNGEAIGRQMLVGDDARTWHTVVGIVDDPPISGFGGGLQPPFTVYLSVLQHPVSPAELLVRATDGRSGVPVVAGAVRRALGDQRPPVSRSERELVAAEQAPLRWFARWLGIEGWVMLGLSAVGVYSLMRLWVISLSAELGLRRSVGARRRQVLGLVLATAAKVGLAGIGIGLWFGPPVWDTMSTTIAGLPRWDPEAFIRYAVLLVGISAAGAWFPAWRAARAGPAQLLAAGES
jgi:putative ABC transport system permease protein